MVGDGTNQNENNGRCCQWIRANAQIRPLDGGVSGDPYIRGECQRSIELPAIARPATSMQWPFRPAPGESGVRAKSSRLKGHVLAIADCIAPTLDQ
jgi:hypothetical protein